MMDLGGEVLSVYLLYRYLHLSTYIWLPDGWAPKVLEMLTPFICRGVPWHSHGNLPLTLWRVHMLCQVTH